MGGRGLYAIRIKGQGFLSKKGGKKSESATEVKRQARFAGGGGGTATDAEMLAEFSSWSAAQSQDNIRAIRSYQGADYSGMNATMRESKHRLESYTDAEKASFKRKVARLEKAISHTLTRDVKAFRGTNVSDDATYAAMTSVGSVFKDKGIFSTSIDRGIGKGFMKAGKKNPVFYTVNIPKGTKAAYFNGVSSAFRGERELITKRGSSFKILKKLKDVNGAPHFLIRFVK